MIPFKKLIPPKYNRKTNSLSLFLGLFLYSRFLSVESGAWDGHKSFPVAGTIDTILIVRSITLIQFDFRMVYDSN